MDQDDEGREEVAESHSVVGRAVDRWKEILGWNVARDRLFDPPIMSGSSSRISGTTCYISGASGPTSLEATSQQ